MGLFKDYVSQTRKPQGGVMGEVHQFLTDHFPWEESRKKHGIEDGSGQILDIGCGAAALTNRIAKTYAKCLLDSRYNRRMI